MSENVIDISTYCNSLLFLLNCPDCQKIVQTKYSFSNMKTHIYLLNQKGQVGIFSLGDKIFTFNEKSIFRVILGNNGNKFYEVFSVDGKIIKINGCADGVNIIYKKKLEKYCFLFKEENDFTNIKIDN